MQLGKKHKKRGSSMNVASDISTYLQQFPYAPDHIVQEQENNNANVAHNINANETPMCLAGPVQVSASTTKDVTRYLMKIR